MKKSILLIAIVLSIVLIPMGSALEVPVTSYWGTVSENNILQSNAVITVHDATGNEIANTTSLDSSNMGLYQINVPWDDLTTSGIDEGVIDGETITFKIDGKMAASRVIDTKGSNIQLDLSVTVAVTTAVIKFTNHSTMPGSSITIPVWLDNGSSVAGGSFKVIFNSDVANVTGVSAGDFSTPIYNINNTNGLVFISLAGTNAVGKSNAILANITFNISAGVSTGASTVLGLQETDLNDVNGGVVVHSTLNGLIKIEGTRGDVNRNGRRDTGDATLMLRTIVELPIPSQYQPVLPIGDMNCNNRIDTGDATLVLRDIVSLPIPRCWE